MKRKLIEVHQEFLIVCDNKQCDYKIENLTGDPNQETFKYVNMPCPQCGDNLLTIEDYMQSKKVMRIVNWLNKWFSWLVWFSPLNATKKKVKVHVHSGVKITDEQP
jgi:hypothetical protein